MFDSASGSGGGAEVVIVDPQVLNNLKILLERESWCTKDFSTAYQELRKKYES